MREGGAPARAGSTKSVSGPLRKTVSPAVLMKRRRSAICSPSAGEFALRSTVSESATESRSAGKSITRSIATAPPTRANVRRTRANATPLKADASPGEARNSGWIASARL